MIFIYLLLFCVSPQNATNARAAKDRDLGRGQYFNYQIIRVFLFPLAVRLSLSHCHPIYFFIICCVDRIRVPRSLRKSLLCCTSTLLTWCRIKSKFTHRSREEILLPHKIIYFDFFFLFFFAVLAVYSLRLQLCLWGCGLIKSET